MKVYGGVDIEIQVFVTSELVGGEWSASRPDRFTSRERAPGTHWKGGWVVARAGLEDVDKRKFLTLQGFEIRPLGRPARSQSLYRLRYNIVKINTKKIHNFKPSNDKFMDDYLNQKET
jgi:hypothetical protein